VTGRVAGRETGSSRPARYGSADHVPATRHHEERVARPLRVDVVGRFDPAATGLSWTAGELSRYTYFSHWAAEEIGRVFTGRPELRDAVRPRRPLALLDDSTVHLFASTTETGLTADWSFGEQCRRRLDPDELWVFERANGTRTLAELAREWPGDRAALDRCLAGLCAAGLLSELLDRLRWEGPPRRVVATSKMFKQLARLTGAPAQREGPFAHREPGGQARGHPWRFAPARSAGRRRGVGAEVTLSALKVPQVEICPWALREGILLRGSGRLERRSGAYSPDAGVLGCSPNGRRDSMSEVNPIELQKYLSGVDYPAKRDDLVRAAERNGADQGTLDVLRALPDRSYEGPSGVSKEIGR
jgi:hypothetical protein